ncbi:MAG: tetratricopeptide repeat protein, partial [Ignavibacterium sp.]
MNSVFRSVLLLILLVSNLSFPQSNLSEIDSINSIDYQEIVSNLTKYDIIFLNNLNEAKNIGYEKGIAKALSNLALVHYLKGDYDESIQYHIE